MAKTVVSIKKLWYADPIDAIAGSALTGEEVYDLIADVGTKEISNVHGDTWAYEEAEASVTDYVNQLNGKVYYRDNVPGAVNMSFSIGQYDYETKAALQGGTATGATTKTGWQRGNGDLVYKCMIAKTKDDTYIVFPKAGVSARGGMVEKAIGILLSAVALETEVTGLASECWFDATEVVAGP